MVTEQVVQVFADFQIKIRNARWQQLPSIVEESLRIHDIDNQHAFIQARIDDLGRRMSSLEPDPNERPPQSSGE